MPTRKVKTNLFLTFEIAAKCVLHTTILKGRFFKSANKVSIWEHTKRNFWLIYRISIYGKNITNQILGSFYYFFLDLYLTYDRQPHRIKDTSG